MTEKIHGWPHHQLGDSLPGHWLNIKNKLIFFDGTKPHKAEDFVGERFPIVGFTPRVWPKAPQTFTIPNIHEIAFAENATIEYENVILHVAEYASEIDTSCTKHQGMEAIATWLN